MQSNEGNVIQCGDENKTQWRLKLLLECAQSLFKTDTIIKFKNTWREIDGTLSNPKYNEIIEEYKNKFAMIGWNVIYELYRVLMFPLLIIYIIIGDKSSYEFYLFLLSRILISSLLLSVKRYAENSKTIINNVFFMLVILQTLHSILTDIKNSNPLMGEYWHSIHMIWWVISIVNCFNPWKIITIKFFLNNFN